MNFMKIINFNVSFNDFTIFVNFINYLEFVDLVKILICLIILNFDYLNLDEYIN